MRGIALGTVLLLATVAAVAAFTMAALTVSHLNFAQHHAHGQDALYLAESALNEAVGRIHNNRTYGKNKESVEIRPDPADSGRWGLCSFDPGRAGQVPTSSNDLPADAASGGTAHLVAVGHSGGARKSVEVLLSLPAYSYALSSAGSVNSPDSVNVRGMGPTSPGNLASNGSVKLDGTSQVAGDLLAMGSINLGPGSQVLGRLLPHSPATDMPYIDLTQWDPRSIPELRDHTQSLDPNPSDTLVQGSMHTDPGKSGGNLNIQGNLQLDQGLLYVDGDLTVQGKVAGNGAVVVKGKTTIQGSVAVRSIPVQGSQVALLSGDSVNLHPGPDTGQPVPAFFQGLVYTRGDFEATQVETSGVFVLGPSRPGDTTSDRGMTLKHVNLTLDSQAAQMTVTVTPPTAPQPSDLFFMQGTGGLRTQGYNEATPFVQQNFNRLVTPLEDAAAQLMAGKPWGPIDLCPEEAGGVLSNGAAVALTDWSRQPSVRAVVNDYYRYHPEAPPIDPSIPLNLVVGFWTPPGMPDPATLVPAAGHVNLQATGQRFAFNPVAPVAVFTIMGPFAKGTGTIPGQPSPGQIHLSAPQAQAILSAYAGGRNGQAVVDAIQADVMALGQKWADLGNAELDQLKGPGGPVGGTTFTKSLDLNQFLQDSSPMRVLAWRERD